MGSSDLITKALVSLAIEKALIDVGVPTYDQVIHQLHKKFHCYLPDCYEHPEYLKEVLSELYGDSSRVIIDSIMKDLEEFSYKKQIEKFLQVLSKTSE